MDINIEDIIKLYDKKISEIMHENIILNVQVEHLLKEKKDMENQLKELQQQCSSFKLQISQFIEEKEQLENKIEEIESNKN